MILVVGATGQLGGRITRELLARGKDVRVLVRPGSTYQPLVDLGAQTVFGDLKDRSSLDGACQGIETLITTANSAQRGGEDNPETVDHKGNQNLIDAAKAAGVQHFIFVSALGVSPSSPVPFIRAKAHTEDYLRDSGLTYTILAPNAFMEVWMGMVIGLPLQHNQPVTLVADGSHRHTFISINDVAAFAMAAVDTPAARNQYLPLGGPEAISYREAVGVFERVLGRSIAVQSVGVGEPVPLLPEAVQPLFWMQETYESPLDTSELARTFGVRQTTLEEYARRAFATVPA